MTNDETHKDETLTNNVETVSLVWIDKWSLVVLLLFTLHSL